MMEHTTKATQLQASIAELADQGLDPVDVAVRLGLTLTRVEQILDRIEGVPIEQPKPPVLTIKEPAAPTTRPKPPMTHGTPTAYRRHYNSGEKPCQSCRDAWNKAQRAKTAAAKTKREAN